MTRPIDADALKDDILKSAVMIDDRGIQTGYEIAIELIKKQPTIDAEPHWIPCSERLPENSGCVLVSIAGDIEFGAYDRQNSDWAIWDDSHWNEGKAVDAWMPLPKPYEGDKE
jgi:hypothetical protein